jgi:hypothetical protein
MGRVKALVMDFEDKFIDNVSEIIGGCECVDELLTSLEKDGSMDLITHMTDSDKLDFIGELWNDFWLEKV